MKNKDILLFLLLLVFGTIRAQKDEKEQIETVINRFFEAMQKSDSAMLRNTLSDDPILQSYMADESGELKIYTEDLQELLGYIASPHAEKIEERITFKSIEVEKSLASVWTPYKFYVNDRVSHCGTNSFQLIKQQGKWKIHYILDTRRKKGC